MMRALASLALTLASAASAADTPMADILVSKAPFIAEGVAIGPRERLLVSGVYGKTVLIERKTGFAAWLRPGRFAPLGGLFGMEADPGRDRLWIAEVSGAEVPGDSGVRRTGIIEVQLSSGKVLARHAVPADGRDRWLGDLALGREGSVYASDSKSGGVYRLAPGKAIALIAQLPLKSPQGLVVTRDGAGLILADYATGLHRVDLATGADDPLDSSTAQLKGIDGLERDGLDLIATQNGTSPNRVLRIRLARDERRIEGVDILAREPERLDDLALGAVVGDRFVFVAHSQWAAVGTDGQLPVSGPPARLTTLKLR